MEVKEIADKNVWEDFLQGQKEKSFLQSWNWGEFQERMGNKVWRLGAFDRGNLKGLALVSKIEAKRGKFLLIQHGPVILAELLEVFLKKLEEIADEEGCAFVRMNPLWQKTKENKKLFEGFGFKKSPMHANAYEATWKLDLTPSEEELLMNMRKTTRYLIRQGLKNQELEITGSESPEDVSVFDKLNKEVARHQNFVPFSFQYVKNEFEVFLKDGQARLFFGKYQGEVVASALVIFWSGIGFYHQAALLPQYHKLPISYLLQWE
ncbi:MAG: peptidoglycan bridge formation glycyltransferase FemA/FemB family protein, partial [bacterium]|nr:peptidoglycan bridge formation glycyltransferase FemA/FemB family protein [bacterium]